MQLSEFKKKIIELGGSNFDDLDHPNDIIVELAKQVFTIRTKAGLTQAELARKLGIKQSVIARLESGNL